MESSNTDTSSNNNSNEYTEFYLSKKPVQIHTVSRTTSLHSDLNSTNKNLTNLTNSYLQNKIPLANRQTSPIKNSKNMSIKSLFVFVIFGSFLLILKLMESLFSNYSQIFFIKGVRRLSKEMLLYFVLLIFVYVLWTFGLFYTIKINWEYTLASIGIFGLCWIVFCFILLSFTISYPKKWEQLEKDFQNPSSNFFITLVKIKDYSNTKNNNSNSLSYYKEYIQYSIMKTQFCVPFYPLFKPSVLKKDFRFDIYLSLSMLKNLKKFFRFSWTSFFIVICSFLIWSVYIAQRNVQFIVIKN